MAVNLYPHQIKAVEELRSGNILHGDVGTGKTLTALAYYMKNEAPRNIYVLTTALKRDTLDFQMEAIQFGIGNLETPLTGKLTVDSWNNISKYTGVTNSFFLLDEQRLVGSGAWVNAFLHITKPERNNTWILLSGTPGDSWLDYAPVFTANGFYESLEDFKDIHVQYDRFAKFPKIKRYLETERLIRLKRQLVIRMEYARHTTRISQNVLVSYDLKLFDVVTKDRWNPYKERPIQSLAEYFYVMRRVVYSDPSRLEAVRGWMKRHPRLIVFYNFIHELEMLRTLTSEIPLAEYNGQKHEEIPKTDRWIYLVQYTAGAEGWNCISTDATLFYSLTYSFKQFEQAHGRIDRLNTPFNLLHYYTLLSDSPIDQAVMRSLKTKHSFNQGRYARELGGFEPIN